MSRRHLHHQSPSDHLARCREGCDRWPASPCHRRAGRDAAVPLALTLLLVSAITSACGTLAEGNGGSDNLPRRDIVPFEKLSDNGQEELRAPFVLGEEGVDLVEPSALARASRIVLYMARLEEDSTSIVRATSSDGVQFSSLRTVMTPEADWEEAWISAPDVVLHDGTYYLFYVGGQAHPSVGLATSPDGLDWTRLDGPVLEPPEGYAITTTSVIRLDGHWVMYYGLADLTDVGDAGDGDEDADPPPTVIHRADSSNGAEWTLQGPVLTQGEGCRNNSGAEVRCWDHLYVDSPGARVVTTPNGRSVVDLWYTGGSGRNASIGYAGSYDGMDFSRFRHNPVLGDGGPERGPSVIDWGDAQLMFYSDRLDGHGAIAVAVHR